MIEDELQNTVTGWMRVDFRRALLLRSSRFVAFVVVAAVVALMSFKHDKRVEMTLADSHRHEKSHSSSSVDSDTSGPSDDDGITVFCIDSSRERG